jgi:competence ComEA-like helix-hairpin-helix protein
MSIIREDEGNLDASIWHMERAFEVQPYNSAIQNELRRLYGRRDGMEPPKVRLTRGALARMYAKGNLYDQAIAELRAALSEDSDRPDLQVLLANTYVQSGKIAEAIEACSALIKKLPYCLEANRLLIQILPKKDPSADIQAYLKRVRELDPYEAHISPNTPTADDVPDAVVNITKIEWGVDTPMVGPSQPEWATSLGVDLSASDEDEEEMPEWLAPAMDRTLPLSDRFPDIETPAFEEETPLEMPREAEPVAQAAPGEGEEEIPDWMKAAGWEPSDGSVQEPIPAFTSEDEESEQIEDAVMAEIPDWLQELAPGSKVSDTPEQPVPPIDMGSEDLPGWLEETPPGPTDTIITWLDEKQAQEAEEVTESEEALPDWLESPEIAATAGAAAAAAVAARAAGTGPDREDSEPEALPDWLSDLEEEAPQIGEPIVEVEPPVEEAEEIPDWLFETTEEAPSEAAEITEPKAEPPAEIELPTAPDEYKLEAEAESEELPDWLSDLEEEAPEISEPIVKVEPPVEEAEEIPDWLFETTEEAPSEAAEITEPMAEPSAEIELPTAPDEYKLEAEAESEELPDWLSDLEEEAPEISEPIVEVELPVEEAEEIPDWLLEMTEEAPSEAVEIIEPEEIPAEAVAVETEGSEPPDWLADLEEEAPEVAEPEEAVLEVVEITEPEELPAEVVKAEAEAAELPDWLADLEGEAPEAAEPEEALPEAAGITKPEELPADAVAIEAEEAELPDWLSSFGEEEMPEVAEPEEALPEAAEITEPEEIPAEAIAAEATAAELPDWLSGLEEEIPEVAEPVEALLEAAEVEEIPIEITPVAEAEVIAAGDVSVDTESGEMPDWLEDLVEEAPEEVEPEVAPELREPGEMPDWLEDLVEKPPETVEVEAAAEEVAEEVLPKPEVEAPAIEPEPPAEVEPPVTEVVVEVESADIEEPEDVPEWLHEVGVEAGTTATIGAVAAITPEPEEEAEMVEPEPTPEVIEEMPDWLRDEEEEPPIAAEESATGIPEPDETPEWLQELTRAAPPELDEEGLPAALGQAEMPEWLQEVAGDTLKEVEKEPFEPMPVGAPEAPDWLKDEEEELPEFAETEPQIEAEAAAEEGEVPDWLKEAAEDIPDWLGSEDQEVPIAAEAAPVPDWIEELPEPEVGEPEAALEPVAMEAEEKIPEEIEAVAEEETFDTEPSDEDLDVLPDWLLDMAEETPEETVEPPAVEAEIIAEIPAESIVVEETLPKEIETVEAEAPTPIEEAEPEVPTPPLVEEPIAEVIEAEAPAPFEEAEPEIDLEDEAAALAWLESLAAKQGVAEEELITQPEERREAPPEWVQEALDEGEAPPEKAAEAPPPDWLQQAAEEAPDEVAEMIEREDEIPTWLEEIPTEEAPIPEAEAELPEPVSEVEAPAPVEVEAPEIDFEDTDAAMAWLESLAAKHGVAEEELVTRPEDRSEVPPEWVQEAAAEETEAEVSEVEIEEELPKWLPDQLEEAPPELEEEIEIQPELTEWLAETIEAEPPPEAPLVAEEALPTVDMDDTDAAMAWLESLAAKHGVAEEELISKPEERPETPPDWVQEDISAAPETEAVPPPEIAMEPEEPIVHEDEAAAATEPAAAQAEEPPTPVEEAEITPPTWVVEDIEPEVEEEPEAYDWIPEEAPEEVVAEAEEKIDLNQASLIQLERLPGIGFRRAQSIVIYRQEHGAIEDIDDLRDIEGVDADTLEILSEHTIIKPPPTPKPIGTTPLPDIKPEDEHHAKLLKAQTSLYEGDLSGALEHYSSLIKEGQRLDETIEDLNQAVYQHPMNINLLQTLGDAYLRADRLQDALDAYTRAEELLR